MKQWWATGYNGLAPKRRRKPASDPFGCRAHAKYPRPELPPRYFGETITADTSSATALFGNFLIQTLGKKHLEQRLVGHIAFIGQLFQARNDRNR